MDLKVIHDTLRFYLDKFQLGWFTPEEIDNILDRSQNQHFRNLRGVYAIGEIQQDSLLPFKAQYVFTNVSSPGGLITFPGDYESLIAIETPIVDNSVTIYPTVDILNETQISYRKSSQLAVISTKYPAGIIQSGKTFQIYPPIDSAGTVYYLRKPAVPVFVYTSSGREITYNQPSSTQLEWDDQSTEKIIFIALGLLGINLQAGDVLQIADAKEKAIA